jgi:hypothetical protein
MRSKETTILSHSTAEEEGSPEMIKVSDGLDS